MISVTAFAGDADAIAAAAIASRRYLNADFTNQRLSDPPPAKAPPCASRALIKLRGAGFNPQPRSQPTIDDVNGNVRMVIPGPLLLKSIEPFPAALDIIIGG
jgi:hypothetical protein